MSIIDSIQLSGSSYDVRDKSATTVVSLTQQEYDALPSSAKTANILYNITDATAGDLTQYWTSAQTQSAITEAVSGKQDTLVSGTNIKTINNESILGSGNITIQGGGTDTGTVQTMIDQSISGKADSSTVTALTNTVTGHTADTSIHVTTAQTAAWDAKSDFSGSYNDLTNKLSAGTNITIVDNVISAEGGGGTVESAITSGSTNAVESSAIWSATTYNKEVTLQWDNGFPSKLSTNYPSGCKKFVVTVLSDTNTLLQLYNGGSQLSGYININNYSSPSVSIDTFEGITYTISGNDVTFVIPDTITFDQLRTDIRSITSIKAIVEGAWIVDNTYMKSEVDVIQNTLQNNINQKLDSTAYTPVNVDSALNVASTNPVQNQALYSELRITNGGETETTLTFGEYYYSTNYPQGCTQIKVEVDGSNNGSNIGFFNDLGNLGSIMINNWGSLLVDTSNFQGATYEISGTTVIISYPTVTNVTRIQVNAYSSDYVYKAVTTRAPTALKDQVVANTTALGGLKLVKLTESAYQALSVKDPDTLYVVIPDPS